MSTKNFMSNGDAETIFTKFANAIKGKQDKYVTITYAQWLTLTPEQQAAKDYYISDYPASAITAGNVSYDNTTSGMTANKVQGAIDELKSGLTNIKAGVVEVTAEATAYGYATVSVPYGDTNYSVVLTVGYVSNFTEAVLAVSNKTGGDVRVGFFNKSNASLTLPINYVIIPNN